MVNLRELTIEQVQQLIDQLYGRLEKDRALLWFIEEIGELCRSIRKGDMENLQEELGQVSVWVFCLANIFDVPLSEIAQKAYDKEHERQMQKYGEIRPYHSTEGMSHR